MAILYLRVIDVRSDHSGFGAMARDRAKEFVLAPLLTPPKVGDVIEALSDDGTLISKLVVLSGVGEGGWDPEGDPLRWRLPGAAKSRMAYLQERQEIVRAIREYFRAEKFLEAAVPLLIAKTCPDAFINSMKVGNLGWLTTSTEYQIKRLQVGGFERVYTLGSNFRDDIYDQTHNPEFTMLEWNRNFCTLEDVERDIEHFANIALEAIHPGQTHVECGGHLVEIKNLPWPRMTVREVWKKFLNVDVTEDFSLESLQKGVTDAGIEVSPVIFNDRGSLTTFLLDRAQPQFGTERPLFLHEWPAFQTSTAALCKNNPHACERSELYIGGIEVANGFVELSNHQLQAANFSQQNEMRAKEGREHIPPDDKYIEALRLGLPPSAGIAMGVERLIMALTGAKHIRDVMAFPWDER